MNTSGLPGFAAENKLAIFTLNTELSSYRQLLQLPILPLVPSSFFENRGILSFGAILKLPLIQQEIFLNTKTKRQY